MCVPSGLKPRFIVIFCLSESPYILKKIPIFSQANCGVNFSNRFWSWNKSSEWFQTIKINGAVDWNQVSKSREIKCQVTFFRHKKNSHLSKSVFFSSTKQKKDARCQTKFLWDRILSVKYGNDFSHDFDQDLALMWNKLKKPLCTLIFFFPDRKKQVYVPQIFQFLCICFSRRSKEL